MIITLINPPRGERSRSGPITPVIEHLFFNSPPLGLGYLAAVAEKEGNPVQIIDAPVEKLNFSQILSRVKKFNTTLVGITSTTNFFHSAKELAQRIKEIFPHVPIVIGGPHLSANPRETLSFKCFDIGVIGEGEITFLNLIKVLEKKGDLEQVAGIIFRRDSELFFTKPRRFIDNLDSLPLPARHLLPMGRYRPQPNDQYILPKLSMIASRGCPYGCIFCDKNVFGKRYRSFSPGYIVSEMEHLIENYGARDIAFLDSTFTVSRERVERIIEEIERRNVKINWTCTVRANIMTKDLLKRMKDAGCWRIRLGIESGNDQVLRFIKKGITPKQARDVAHWAHQVGLQPKGFFMIGHLVDTKETIEETIRFANSLPFKDITVQINTPLPNTPQYGIFKDYGELATEDFSKFSFWQPVFLPQGLTYGDLIRAHRGFYRRFYLRPIIWWRHLRHIRRFSDLKKYFRALKLLFHLFFFNLRRKVS